MVSKHRFRFRSIPRVWQLTACLLVMITAVVAVIVLGWRATHTGYACLLIEGWNQIGLLDVDSGNYFLLASTTKPPPVPSPKDNYILSPDAKRSVHFERSDTFATAPDNLAIQLYRASLPLSQRPRLSSQTSWELENAVWSPDGLWIAYYWRTDDRQEFLALADADGHQQQVRVLTEMPGEAIQIDSWSPDSKYFALLSHQSNAISIRFWSVPDLQSVGPNMHSNLLSGAFSGCVPQNTASTSCIHWSKQGHQAAYVSADSNNEAQLIITRPGETAESSFTLPNAAKILSWSPDGRYIAVSAQVVSSATVESLSLFGVDGTQLLDIITVPKSVICDTCSLEMEWMPDGKSILYALNRQDLPRVDLSLSGKVAIALYGLSTRDGRIVFSSPQSSQVAIYPSPDNVIVAMETDPDLFLVSLAEGWTRKLQISAINGGLMSTWSPDATLLATAYRLTQGSAIDIFSAEGSEARHYVLPDSTNGMTWTTCRLA